MKKITAAQQRFFDNAVLIAALRLIFEALAKLEFPIYPLGQIAETTSGGTPDRRFSQYYGGNVPWIKSGELNDRRIQHCEEYITEEGLQNSSAKIYPNGTLVVALYGATVGKVGILTFDAASNQAVCAITPSEDHVSTEFLFWFLRYKRPEFLNSSFGGAQPNISQKILRKTSLPLPPFELQGAICTYLEMLQEHQGRSEMIPEISLPEPLSHLNRVVARIEELAAKIEEARGLRRKVVEEAHSLKRSYLNSLFSSDKAINWTSTSLGNIADIRAGVTLGRFLQEPTIDVPYLRVANVQDGRLDLRVIKRVNILPDELEKWKLQSGDILLTEGGDWDKLGRGTVWRDEIPDCIHQNHIFRIRLDQTRFDPKFIVEFIGSPIGKTYFQAAAKQTTNLASINQRQLKAFGIFIPPLDEQRRIVAHLDALQERVDTLKREQAASSAELDALLPSILDKAFKGEL